MSNRLISALIVGVTLAFSSVLSVAETPDNPNQATFVTNIRLHHESANTRIVFDLSADTRHTVFQLINPKRIVVDFDNAKLQKALPSVTSENAHILNIRSGQPAHRTLRIVFELKKTLAPSSFVLSPNELYGHRLVIDLKQPASQIPQGQGSQTPVNQPTNHVSTPALIEPEHASPKVDATTAENDVAPVNVLENVTPTTPPLLQNRQLIVAIDAGHGGQDPGAIGYRGSHEKKITLAIAKRLKDRINKNPRMKAVLIREGDYFIELHKRRTQARNLNADIFVSIHADAFTKKSAHGLSVFALSQRGATSAMARALAAKENAADLIGGVSLADKDQVLAQVLVDLSMTNTINESVNLGGRVLKELAKLGKLHSKRVEQAGFAVLKSPDMPSILIETGFITNPDEEKKLRSSRYQKKLANAIYTAIDEYYQQTPYFSNAHYASPSLDAKPSTSKKASPRVHVVKRGDSLSKISARYNVTIKSLKRLNKLKRDTVFLGQKIKLPASLKSSVSKKPLANKKPRYHKVKRGDTLSEIAERYGSSIKKIMHANNMRKRTVLLGQTLKIPY